MHGVNLANDPVLSLGRVATVHRLQASPDAESDCHFLRVNAEAVYLVEVVDPRVLYYCVSLVQHCLLLRLTSLDELRFCVEVVL